MNGVEHKLFRLSKTPVSCWCIKALHLSSNSQSSLVSVPPQDSLHSSSSSS